MKSRKIDPRLKFDDLDVPVVDSQDDTSESDMCEICLDPRSMHTQPGGACGCGCAKFVSVG